MNKTNSIKKIFSNNLSHYVLVAIAYFLVYFHLPSTPGNAPLEHPEGWWGWFDQGQYLKASIALSKLDFNPSNYYYPPLYTIIGGLLINFSSGHPFIIINLICLLGVMHIFIKISNQYLPNWTSLLVFYFTVVFNKDVFQNYAIPWTSTLSNIFICLGLLGIALLYEFKIGKRISITKTEIALVSLSLGLVIPTRPADALTAFVIGFSYCLYFIYLHYTKKNRSNQNLPHILPALALIISAASLGTSIYLVFNKFIFGDFLGSYYHHSTNIGFVLGDLLEKFISIFIDGKPLYGENGSGILQHYIWIYLSIIGIIWVFFQKGMFLLKTISVAIIVTFCLYLSYIDLLPNGLWRYLNIHYFKWMFPYFGLFAALITKQIFISVKSKKAGYIDLVWMLSGIMLLYSLHFVFSYANIINSDIDYQKKELKITNTTTDIMDFVDLHNVSGGFNEVYFGNHKLYIDGRELTAVKDFRILPMEYGVRILFIRPQSGDKLIVHLDNHLEITNNPKIRIGKYTISLNMLDYIKKNDQSL